MSKNLVCPVCGVAMWAEGTGDVRHPMPTECSLSGRAFKRTRDKEHDKRLTWDEFVAKHAKQQMPVAPPEKPSAGPKLP